MWRAFFVANFARFMRKFLLIEGYLVGENELNGETFKKKYQSYIGEAVGKKKMSLLGSIAIGTLRV